MLAQLAGAHRGDLDVAAVGVGHADGHPAPVDPDDQAGDGVVVAGAGAGARPGTAPARADPDVVLVGAAVERATGHQRLPRPAAHRVS